MIIFTRCENKNEALTEAENQYIILQFELGPLDQVTKEWRQDGWISSGYDKADSRAATTYFHDQLFTKREAAFRNPVLIRRKDRKAANITKYNKKWRIL